MATTRVVLRVLRRILSVGVASLAVVVAMVFFFAWVALRIPWEVPDRGAVTGPSEILARDGTLLARFDRDLDRRLVRIEDVALVAQQAVVAAEDARFYEHDGVDPPSLIRAVVTNLRTDGITQGGSTLTQQYVKNAFLTPERTITRKIREAVISIALERQMEKDEILEAYLNEVYFGEGAYGIEAAARTYFGVTAAQLDPAESATLAQLLPAPSARNPRNDREGARVRRNALLQRMADLGMLTQAEADTWIGRPMLVLPPRSSTRREPHFVEYVRRQIVDAYGEEILLTGRLTIQTTLELDHQDQLRQAVENQLPRQEPPLDRVDAGAAVVDPATGEILAMYGGRSFEESQVDLATQLDLRQPGSTFKPFVFVAALEQGIGPDTVYRAPGRVVPDGCTDDETGFNPFAEAGGVANAGGRGFGSMSISRALSNSVNTVFVQLGCDIGPEYVVDVMGLMGVRNQISTNPGVSIGSLANGPSPLDMASAYATLANDGLACPATAILRIAGPDGDLPVPDGVTTGAESGNRSRVLSDEELGARHPDLVSMDRGRCRQVIHPNNARLAIEAMEVVVEETTATRAQIDIPQAGKTGTTDGPREAWFVGFTPAVSIAVFVGDTIPPLEDLRGVAGFRRVFGGTIPALIWRDAARAILADVPASDFAAPGEYIPPGLGFGAEDEDRVVVGPARGRPAVPRPAAETTAASDSDEATEEGTILESGGGGGTRPDPGDEPTPTETSEPPPSDPEDPSENEGGCLLVIGDC